MSEANTAPQTPSDDDPLRVTVKAEKVAPGSRWAVMEAGTDVDGDGTLDEPVKASVVTQERAPPRDHMIMVERKYRDRMGKLPIDVWNNWQFLMAEALWRKDASRAAKLELFVYSSPTVDGFGMEKQVEAMRNPGGGTPTPGESGGILPSITINTGKQSPGSDGDKPQPQRRGFFGWRRG